MIQELIYQKFGVLYSVKYLSELLKNLGFSYQKARFAVGGKDPENILKRKTWLWHTWPEIVKKASNRMHISCSVMRHLSLNGEPSLIHGLLSGSSLLYPLQVSAKDIRSSG